MKKNSAFILLLVFISISILSCSKSRSVRTTTTNQTLLNEESAIQKLSKDIFAKYEILKNKKIGIFDFSTLDGKENPDGKRLSKKLLEQLIKKGGLKFVERSEIDKLLKAQGIEQTGIIDPETIKESGKVFSIDVMINGTISRVNRNGELSIKAVDLSTGEIYLAASVNFVPAKKLAFKEDPKLVRLHRESPDKVQILNRTFFALERLSNERPVIFLLSVIRREDIPNLRDKNPKLARVLKKRRENIKSNNPQVAKKIYRLREGIKLLKDHVPERFDIIMKKKDELILRKPRRRPGR